MEENDSKVQNLDNQALDMSERMNRFEEGNIAA